MRTSRHHWPHPASSYSWLYCQQEPPKQLRRVAALAGAATADEPSVKAMNNYLGIGIDAKAGTVGCSTRDVCRALLSS